MSQEEGQYKLSGVLTLLTDFGLTDYYVGAVKGTVLRLAPGSALVDLSHDVVPGDVAGAAFLLGAAAPSFPPGTVHLAVVDPGVGSERRILVARRGEARRGEALYVAPDNGLLTPLLDGAEVRSVARRDLFLPSPGATFHGRDRFAPVAAYLLRGEDPQELGPSIDDPVRLPLQAPVRSPDRLRGTIVHIDRFGNLVTDIPAAWLGDRPCRAIVGSHTTERRITHYAELSPGEPGLLTGSLGTLELSLNGTSLARHWDLERGTLVEILLLL